MNGALLQPFLNLIDRLIAMAKRREEVSRNLYADYVKPTMEDFEKVHQDYLESFKRYRTLIQDPAHPLGPGHPLMEEIRQDNLYSEALRTKLEVLYEQEFDPVIGPLIRAIRVYMRHFSLPLLEYPALDLRPWWKRWEGPPVQNIYRHRRPRTQNVRSEVSRNLQELFKDGNDARKKRTQALKVLDLSVRDLQERYLGVIEAKEQLRTQLLRPH
jgi:hypothetical protein